MGYIIASVIALFTILAAGYAFNRWMTKLEREVIRALKEKGPEIFELVDTFHVMPVRLKGMFSEELFLEGQKPLPKREDACGYVFLWNGKVSWVVEFEKSGIYVRMYIRQESARWGPNRHSLKESDIRPPFGFRMFPLPIYEEPVPARLVRFPNRRRRKFRRHGF